MDRFVFLKDVPVYDDIVFTVERTNEWKNHIIDVYEDVFTKLKEKIDPSCSIKFSLNKSLLDETIVDAVIGMRKITDSKFNGIEDPNSFKIISYLAYWWLRHKPANVYYYKEFELDNIKLSDTYPTNNYEYDRQKLIWQLKHVNELVAVQMVCTYIFDFDNVLCHQRQCARVKKHEQDRFPFDSFDEMKDILLKKLLYYFSYRAVTPKTIEHILEGYTFHPAWGLTGTQWSFDDSSMDL